MATMSLNKKKSIVKAMFKILFNGFLNGGVDFGNSFL